MDKRKDAILGFLKASGQASLADVASHLEVSKQGALRHLETLLAEGLVEKGVESHNGPGRPEHVYRLTAAAAERFPHAHRELAGELVRFMGAAEGGSDQTVWAITEDAKGRIWAGTNGDGAIRIDAGGVRHFTVKDGLASNFIWQVLSDSRDDIWLFGNVGLTVVHHVIGTHLDAEAQLFRTARDRDHV